MLVCHCTSMLVETAALLTLILTCGCSGWKHGSTLAYYQGAILDARDVGAERVRIEAAYDATIADYLKRNGTPDYVLVGGDRDVEFVYVTTNRLVYFHRSPLYATSTLAERPIPEAFLRLIPEDRAHVAPDAGPKE